MVIFSFINLKTNIWFKGNTCTNDYTVGGATVNNIYGFNATTIDGANISLGQYM